MNRLSRLSRTLRRERLVKKWQKAFELANELNHQDGLIRSAGVMQDIIHMLTDDVHYDAKTRAYMAMALSRFQTPAAEQALWQAASDVELNNETEFPIFLMWAIGNYGNPDSAKAIARFLKSDQGDLRKTAAYVLGVVGNRSFRRELKGVLDDPIHDVRWNAALSLARLGDDAGSEVLIKILDRDYLANAFQMDEAQIEALMTNAAKGFALIRHASAIPVLETLSNDDPNLKVRQEALTALKFQRN